MATEFKLPELGENIKQGDVVNINVSVGDKIHKDQIVMELETDKAVIEVPSSVGGVVKEILVKVGAKAKVGQVVLILEGESESKPAKAVSEPAAAPKKEIPAEPPAAALLKTNQIQPPVEDKKDDGDSAKSTGSALAAPSVRKLAREIGVDLDEVKASGPSGRITVEDIKASARRANTDTGGFRSVGNLTVPTIELPDFSRFGLIERKAMTSVRRKTAERMSQAWTTIPHVTQHDDADITELENLRTQFGKHAQAAGGNLTVTVIVLKIVASALKKFPQFNASIDMASQEIIYKKYCNIGVAVDTDRGLLVPVIRDVDKKNIIRLSVELNESAERARIKKTTLEEMQGGSFTITNLGGIGGTYFTPIINPPEVAILGLGRWRYQQVYANGQFQARKILPLSLSYDHRIIDGADAARFLRWIADAVNEPFLMDLEG